MSNNEEEKYKTIEVTEFIASPTEDTKSSFIIIFNSKLPKVLSADALLTAYNKQNPGSNFDTVYTYKNDEKLLGDKVYRVYKGKEINFHNFNNHKNFKIKIPPNITIGQMSVHVRCVTKLTITPATDITLDGGGRVRVGDKVTSDKYELFRNHTRYIEIFYENGKSERIEIQNHFTRNELLEKLGKSDGTLEDKSGNIINTDDILTKDKYNVYTGELQAIDILYTNNENKVCSKQINLNENDKLNELLYKHEEKGNFIVTDKDGKIIDDEDSLDNPPYTISVGVKIKIKIKVEDDEPVEITIKADMENQDIENMYYHKKGKNIRIKSTPSDNEDYEDDDDIYTVYTAINYPVSSEYITKQTFKIHPVLSSLYFLINPSFIFILNFINFVIALTSQKNEIVKYSDFITLFLIVLHLVGMVYLHYYVASYSYVSWVIMLLFLCYVVIVLIYTHSGNKKSVRYFKDLRNLQIIKFVYFILWIILTLILRDGYTDSVFKFLDF